MAERFSKMLPILPHHLPGPRSPKRRPILPSRSTRLLKSEPTRRRHLKPPLLLYQHKLFFLLLAFLSLIQPTIAQKPYNFPALPQVFASKSACREVYDECIQAFRDCLKAVGGNEPGRLGCEAYRNDVCEEHIRVGCDQLPNGGGSIGPVPTDIPIQTGGDSDGDKPTSTTQTKAPPLTTFLTVEPIKTSQTQTETQTTHTSKRTTSTQTPTQKNPTTTTPKSSPDPTFNPEPDSPIPEATIQPADPVPTLETSTTTTPLRPTAITTQQQPPQPSQSPFSTITLTSTAPNPTLATVAVVITTVIATTTDQAGISQTRTWTTSTTVTRGLTFNVVSGGVGMEWGRWSWVVMVVGVHLGLVCL